MGSNPVTPTKKKQGAVARCFFLSEMMVDKTPPPNPLAGLCKGSNPVACPSLFVLSEMMVDKAPPPNPLADLCNGSKSRH